MPNAVHSQPRYTRRLVLRPFRRRDVGPLHDAIEVSLADLQPWLPWVCLLYTSDAADELT